MSATATSMEPTRKKRNGALVTGLVLAAMALGIYLVVILKFMR